MLSFVCVLHLQGRLPIRVDLSGLTKEHLYRILTAPDNNTVVQQKALLATEGVTLDVTDCAIREIAEVACVLSPLPLSLSLIFGE